MQSLVISTQPHHQRLLKTPVTISSPSCYIVRKLLPTTYYCTYYLLPTAYYLLPTTYYLLPTTYYLLPTTVPTTVPTTYYLLPTTYYSYLLPTTYYLLPTTYYLLPTTYTTPRTSLFVQQLKRYVLPRLPRSPRECRRGRP